jgi:hypothetical protein
VVISCAAEGALLPAVPVVWTGAMAALVGVAGAGVRPPDRGLWRPVHGLPFGWWAVLSLAPDGAHHAGVLAHGLGAVLAGLAAEPAVHRHAEVGDVP